MSLLEILEVSKVMQVSRLMTQMFDTAWGGKEVASVGPVIFDRESGFDACFFWG
jgi:hypothetical protein